MRDLKNRLTPGKNTRNIQRRKGKSFGYQILGFGTVAGLPAGIGLIAGGLTPSHTQNIDKILLTSTGTATDFGDLSTSFTETNSSCGSSTRGLHGGAVSPGNPGVASIDYSTFSTAGNAVSFGNLVQTGGERGSSMSGVSNETRGIWYGGFNSPGSGGAPAPETDTFAAKEIQYVTIASTGDSSDFGDLIKAKYGNNQGCASTTRGILFGGTFYGGPSFGQPQTTRPTNVIEYITIGSTGNSTDFGDLSASSEGNGSGSSSTRAVLSLGNSNATFPPSNFTNTMEYVTIASTGNTTDFGDMTISAGNRQGNSDSTKVFFAGGGTPSVVNTVDQRDIATTGDLSDYGDLTQVVKSQGFASSAHGGL
tara:strand:- start:454 stop:1548 length:1095 start_codon:yes stop_codon:yes gene_type:complete